MFLTQDKSDLGPIVLCMLAGLLGCKMILKVHLRRQPISRGTWPDPNKGGNDVAGVTSAMMIHQSRGPPMERRVDCSTTSRRHEQQQHRWQ